MAVYSEYKDSGIEWIGNIPSHWVVEKGKHVLSLLDRPVLENDEIITCFRDGEVTLRKNRREDGFTVSLKEIGYQGIEPGDLVVHGMDGFAGAIGVSDSRGKATPVLNVMDSNHNKRYLMYYLRTAAYKDVFMSLSTGIRVRSCDLRWNKLSVFPFVLPERVEQDIIADYIDASLIKINSLIAEARASIDEYKKLKGSVIYEAVTKGLDPDADMVDSGYADIGMVPAHWRLGVIKNRFDIICGATPSEQEDNWGGDIHWIGPADMPMFGSVSGGKRTLTEKGYNSCGTTLVPKGSIVLSTRAPIGKICIAIEEVCTNQGCKCLVPQTQVNTKYYAYYLFSITERMQQDGTGTTFKELSTAKLKDEPMPIVPIEEQNAIALFLDNKCTVIDGLIAEKESLIDDLEAYKKALVFEVVTGKRKVV